MSYAYSRVIPEAVSYKQYGFHSVSPQEMYNIVKRLQTPTYNTELYHGECFKQETCPPRQPSNYCRRAKSANTERNRARPAPTFTSERELDRVYRRVRTPTISKMAAEGKIAPSYETNFEQYYGPGNSQKEISALEQKKITRRLLRPTTAVSKKQFCSFCNDPVLSKYHEYDFSGEDLVSPDEVQDIVDRVRAPTIASEGGIGPTCPKRRDSIGKRASMPNMPLVSGLPRSKNIDEIVSRLYTPTEAIPMCRPLSANSQSVRKRPKSASSAIGSNFLRPLSSYSSSTLVSSRTSLSSRSSASTNRSKFSNVSDYDKKSNKKAIYISRKPPTGKKQINKQTRGNDTEVENKDESMVENDDVKSPSGRNYADASKDRNVEKCPDSDTEEDRRLQPKSETFDSDHAKQEKSENIVEMRSDSSLSSQSNHSLEQTSRNAENTSITGDDDKKSPQKTENFESRTESSMSNHSNHSLEPTSRNAENIKEDDDKKSPQKD